MTQVAYDIFLLRYAFSVTAVAMFMIGSAWSRDSSKIAFTKMLEEAEEKADRKAQEAFENRDDNS